MCPTKKPPPEGEGQCHTDWSREGPIYVQSEYFVQRKVEAHNSGHELACNRAGRGDRPEGVAGCRVVARRCLFRRGIRSELAVVPMTDRAGTDSQ